MVKILIVVEDGVIQDVYATESVDVVVRDFDVYTRVEGVTQLADGSVCVTSHPMVARWDSITDQTGLDGDA